MAESPISHHRGSSEQKPEKPEVSSEQKVQMEQAYQQMQRKLRISKIDEDIKHKIMVLSGKYFDNDKGFFTSPHPDALDEKKCFRIIKSIKSIL